MAQATTHTIDNFWTEYAGQAVELVKGQVVTMTPSGFLSSLIAGELLTELNLYLRQHPLGKTTTADGGYWLGGDELRVPDVGFISNAKLAHVTDPTKYLPFAPDLAVEVVSPTDTAAALHEKIMLYLQAGTQLVWVVYPAQQQVVVYQADGSATTLNAEGMLTGGTLLPDLQIPLSNIFPND